MIVETALISLTVIVVASLRFANKIMERENQDDELDEYGDPTSQDTIRPYHDQGYDCALCGQSEIWMSVIAMNGLLSWTCDNCGGSYKTYPKS